MSSFFSNKFNVIIKIVLYDDAFSRSAIESNISLDVPIFLNTETFIENDEQYTYFKHYCKFEYVEHNVPILCKKTYNFNSFCSISKFRKMPLKLPAYIICFIYKTPLDIG